MNTVRSAVPLGIARVQRNRITLGLCCFLLLLFFSKRPKSGPTLCPKWVRDVKVNEYKNHLRQRSRANNIKNSCWTPPHIYTGRAASVHIQHLCKEPDMLHGETIPSKTLRGVKWQRYWQSITMFIYSRLKSGNTIFTERQKKGFNKNIS